MQESDLSLLVLLLVVRDLPLIDPTNSLPSALLAGGVVSLRDFPVTLLTFCSVSSAVAPESLRVFSFALLLSARRNSTHIALALTARPMSRVLELMMEGSEACSRHVDAWANEDKR